VRKSNSRNSWPKRPEWPELVGVRGGMCLERGIGLVLLIADIKRFIGSHLDLYVVGMDR